MYFSPNLEPVHFSISDSNCCFLICIQISQEAVRWSGFPSLEEFSTVCCDPHSQRLCVVNKAKVDVFPELSCFFDDPTYFDNLISGSSAFSKYSLNIWKFSFHVLLKPWFENFEHYFSSVWDECNCAVAGGLDGKESACGIFWFNPWVGKSPWKSE